MQITVLWMKEKVGKSFYLGKNVISRVKRSQNRATTHKSNNKHLGAPGGLSWLKV